MSPEILLGPMLRYVGEREATVWLETGGPCEVEVLGHRERTFRVEGHHYAIVVVGGLDPGEAVEYEVALDGERRWPEPRLGLPPSVIRTLDRREPLTVCFGSCRVSVPHSEPHTGPRRGPLSRGRGVDALYALAGRMRSEPRDRWPDLLLMLGDQIYADEVPPATREFIRSRRDTSAPPGEEVADFEEYARLYLEAWSEPAFRWLTSTVSTAMIFDDHDVHDDWNTSRAWVEEMRAKPWWDERIVAGFMSYWLYQQLGNLPPAELRQDGLLRRVREAEDAGPVLRRFAFRADREPHSARWSFSRGLGRAKLVAVDSRAARVDGGGRRSMLDPVEWEWLEAELAGGVDHLLVATSLPVFLAQGAHWMEAFSERLCAGAWGRRAIPVGERLRQAFDLEHWPAFGESFERLVALLRAAAAGERGPAPATITVLSGDVHFAYLAEVAFPRAAGVRSTVHQAVCSPFRNPLGAAERTFIRVAAAGGTEAAARALAQSVGVPDPGASWRFVEEQAFQNQVATLRLDGDRATLRLEHTRPGETGLHPSWERRLR